MGANVPIGIHPSLSHVPGDFRAVQGEFCAADARLGSAGTEVAGNGAEVVEVISNAGIIFALTRIGRCTAFDRGVVATTDSHSLVNVEQFQSSYTEAQLFGFSARVTGIVMYRCCAPGGIQIPSGTSGVSLYYATRVQQVRRLVYNNMRCLLTRVQICCCTKARNMCMPT